MNAPKRTFFQTLGLFVRIYLWAAVLGLLSLLIAQHFQPTTFLTIDGIVTSCLRQAREQADNAAKQHTAPNRAHP
jgi:hypothetical protein